MSFIAYDLFFLVVFTLLVVIFLYTRKHNLKRDGLLYLYRTKIGIKIIEWTSKKYAPILRPLQYVILFSGYVLMVVMVWFLAKFSYTYLSSSTLAEQLRVPVLTPLVPYIDKLFAVDFLPPFYFTYWIIIIAIIAIPHEFAHGIFARLNKVKIHSTGFGFLGPFLAAFVEQDDKDMQKASKFSQLSILAAGTFANVVMTVLFGLLLWLFVATTFAPAGVYFNTYATAAINTSDIVTVGGVSIMDPNMSMLLMASSQIYLELKTKNNVSYFVDSLTIQKTVDEHRPLLFVYEDAPAINAELAGAIKSIDGESITSQEKLRTTITSHHPGDTIYIITQIGAEEMNYTLQLGDREGVAYLGIGTIPTSTSGIRGAMYAFLASVKDPFIYYESKLGDFGIFIYDLLWWIVIINISVALCNMLPVGIFDGGRFFYLTVWGITGSEKIGKKAFQASTWIILGLVAALMIRWALILF